MRKGVKVSFLQNHLEAVPTVIMTACRQGIEQVIQSAIPVPLSEKVLASVAFVTAADAER